VVYWLHDQDGSEGRPELDPAMVDAAIRGRILPPLMVVYVCGGGPSWFVNAADGLRPAELTFLDELIPHVDRTFRTVAGRGGRIVQGVGMGGYGAVRLALSHPDRFCAGTAHAGDFRPASVFAADRGLREAFLGVFGGDTNRFESMGPAAVARRNADRLRGATGLMLVVGPWNPARVGADRLHRVLADLRLSVRRLEVPRVRSLDVVTEAGLAGLEHAVGWLDEARSAEADGPWVNPPAQPVPRVRHHVLYSERLGRPVGYSLYLPERRAGPGPLPVLYHLNGRLEDEGSHLETVGYLDAAIRLGDVPPMAWAWVYGGRLGWFVDAADGRVPGEQVLLGEVLPHVEARWRLGGDPSRRGVDGWGMGAWGALRFAAVEPVRFGAVLLHNPLVPDAATMQERYLEAWATAFGGDPTVFEAREPLAAWARRAGDLRGRVAVRVAFGARAVAPRADALRVIERLSAAGFRVEFEEAPGLGIGGGVLYPRTGLNDMRFFGRHLGTDRP
jgi:S-formylglutathione hydrolase FrmB